MALYIIKRIIIILYSIMRSVCLQIPVTIIYCIAFIGNGFRFCELCLSLILDMMLIGISLLSVFLYQNDRLKRQIQNKDPNDLEIVDDTNLSDLTILNDNIHSGLRKIYQISNPYPPSVILRSIKRSGIKPVTIPNSFGTSIIIQPKSFRPYTNKSYYLTAHEIGHTYHSFNKSDVFGTTIIVILYMSLSALLSIQNNELTWLLWGGVCAFISIITVWIGFESKAEVHADIVALQMIQDQKGVDTMHDAADYLITARISSFHKSSYRKNPIGKIAYANSIHTLAYFINPKTKNTLLDSPYLNNAIRRDILKHGAISDNAKSIPRVEPSAVHILSLALFIAGTYVLVFLSRTSLCHPISHMDWKSVIIVFAVLLTISRIIFKRLWNSHYYLLRQIGIS